MAQTLFPAEWLKKLSDPYAVLGVSVTADDSRILKRYRSVAKILHPDSYGLQSEDKELASYIFARLVNPCYQKLKQEQGRAEILAMLRFQARRLSRQEGGIAPRGELARQLMKLSLKESEVFYEQAIAKLTEQQFQPSNQFDAVSQQLAELNLVYLHLKTGEPFIREKRTGLVATPQNQARQFESSPPAESQAAPTENYALRHYRRAEEYIKKNQWGQAVQELRDAIRVEPSESRYHALLGYVYLQQKLVGMATVHCRQALKLNPKDAIALKYATKLNIQAASSTSKPETTQGQTGKTQNQQTTQPQPTAQAPTAKKGFFFGLFSAKKS